MTERQTACVVVWGSPRREYPLETPKPNGSEGEGLYAHHTASVPAREELRDRLPRSRDNRLRGTGRSFRRHLSSAWVDLIRGPETFVCGARATHSGFTACQLATPRSSDREPRKQSTEGNLSIGTPSETIWMAAVRLPRRYPHATRGQPRHAPPRPRHSPGRERHFAAAGSIVMNSYEFMLV